jgi:hypothetical protein
MKARDVMASHVITVGPELDVKAVANTLGERHQCGSSQAIDGSIVGLSRGRSCAARCRCRAQALPVA